MTKWSMITTIGLLFLVPVVAFGTPARADSDTMATAKQHFDRGQQQFAAGEYLHALEHFQRVYDLTGSPELMYNMARCYEEHGDIDSAIDHFERYLEISDGSDREEVEGRIRWLSEERTRQAEEPLTDGSRKRAEDSNDRDSDADRTSADTSRLKGFILESRMGPAFVILKPRTTDSTELHRHHFFAVDLVGHFLLTDWLAITAVLTFAGYMKGGVPIRGLNPEGHVGIGAGISLFKAVSTRVSLATGLVFLPTAIKRAVKTRRATWIDFQVSAGMHYHLPRSWSLVLDAIADTGPAFAVRPDLLDWTPSAYVAAGARLGAAYRF